MEGEFVGLENAVQVIKSKIITPDNLRAFASLLREAYEKTLSVEETKRRANEIDPALGETVEKLSKAGLWKTSLVLLMLALNQCHLNVDASLDINDLLKSMMKTPPAEVTKVIPLPERKPHSG